MTASRGADARGGTGLTGLLDRVEAADGSLAITSRPGGGTIVRATLPLDDRFSGWGCTRDTRSTTPDHKGISRPRG